MSALDPSDNSPSAVLPATATCYFSLPFARPKLSDAHLLTDHPLIYPPDPVESSYPLLAFRETSSVHYMSSPDAGRILQLQIAAAHRPVVQPLQHRFGTDSASSDSSMGASPSPLAALCCSRCHRENVGRSSMVPFGTNVYYCNHCARMTGYCAG